ncbi:MAG: GIY-YIG nuclease family protein [Candidatus Eisenbacteria bacterium]
MTFYYVYILQSDSHPNRHYVGFTKNLVKRLRSHNSGQSHHTSKYRPWHVRTAVAFTDPKRTRRFERYLKTASGRAFARKRL